MIADDIREVASLFGVHPKEITGPGKTANVYLARCAVIARLDARGLSSVRIGHALNRHHTTILNSLGRLNKPAVR